MTNPVTVDILNTAKNKKEFIRKDLNEEQLILAELLSKNKAEWKFPEQNSNLKIHSKYYLLYEDNERDLQLGHLSG